MRWRPSRIGRRSTSPVEGATSCCDWAAAGTRGRGRQPGEQSRLDPAVRGGEHGLGRRNPAAAGARGRGRQPGAAR
eukprot:1413227-Prymnesium_polylepis.1